MDEEAAQTNFARKVGLHVVKKLEMPVCMPYVRRKFM